MFSPEVICVENTLIVSELFELQSTDEARIQYQNKNLDMFQNLFYNVVQKKKRTERIIFRSDGTPTHLTRTVRSWLNDKFNSRWFERDGSIAWGSQ